MTNEQLVIRIQAGEDTANNMLALWQQNKGFIYKMALKYSGYAEIEDLKQEGYIGLCEAVKHYVFADNVPFINYAAFWIKQSMRRYIDNCSSVVRLPVHAREWLQKYKKLVMEYRKYCGIDPTEGELCAILGVSLDKLHDIQKSASMGRIASLSEPIQDEEGLTIGETVSSDENIEESVAELIDKQEMSRHLWVAVDELPIAQREVIRKRYKENQTYKEIGRSMGVSSSKARNIQYAAISALRLQKRYKRFKGYYEEYLEASSCHHVGVRRFNRTWTSVVEEEALRNE